MKEGGCAIIFDWKGGRGAGQRVGGRIFCHSGERVNIFGSALVNFDRQSRARLGWSCGRY